MILNKNNWFAMYYNWIYGNYPNDVCSFFWGALFALLFAPFIVPGKLILSFHPGYNSPWNDIKNAWVLQMLVAVATFFVFYLIALLGNGMLNIFGYEFLYLWSVVFGGLLIGLLMLVNIAIVIILLYLIGKGIVRLFQKTGEVIPETHIIDNTKDFIGAIRGKYCTKITWK